MSRDLDVPALSSRPAAVADGRPRAETAWRGPALALALVLAAGGSIHGPRVLHNLDHHHWEDFRFLRHARLELRSPLDCFTHAGPWPGLYRPLTANLYYFVGQRAFGHSIASYHLVNAAVFVANGLLLWAIARLLLPSPWSFLPPVLYVTRLAHYQVVLNTTEIQALLSTCFALVCIHSFVSASSRPSGARDGLALAALVLALLSKESVAAVPAILLVHGGVAERPWRWRRHLAMGAVTVAWVAGYVAARRHVCGGQPTGFAYDVSLAIVGRYAAYALSFLNVLVWPIDSREMTTRVVALSGRAWLSAILALGFLASAVAALRSALSAGSTRPAGRVVVFGLAWFLFGMMPYVAFSDRLFIRYTYFGHAGLALAAAGAVWLGSGALRRGAARPSSEPEPRFGLL